MTENSTVRISNDTLVQLIDTQGGFQSAQLGRGNSNSWVWPRKGREFAVYYHGKCFDGATPGIRVGDVTRRNLDSGAVQYTVRIEHVADQLAVESHTIVYDDSDVMEKWVTVINTGVKPVRIDRLDSFSLIVPPDDYELMYFTSGWGLEFGEVREKLTRNVVIDCRKGR